MLKTSIFCSADLNVCPQGSIQLSRVNLSNDLDALEEMGWEIFQCYLDVASGRRQTWAERHRLHNDLALFNPAPVT